MSKVLNMVLFYDHPIMKSSSFSLAHHFFVGDGSSVKNTRLPHPLPGGACRG